MNTARQRFLLRGARLAIMRALAQNSEMTVGELKAATGFQGISDPYLNLRGAGWVKRRRIAIRTYVYSITPKGRRALASVTPEGGSDHAE